MDKNECRAVIKYLYLKDMSPKDIHQDMQNTLKDSAPSYSTVKFWISEFNRGRRSTDDNPRSGRPSETTTQTIVDAVQNTVMGYRRITTRQLALTHSISETTVRRIFHEHLHMSKVSARWVPRMLTAAQKQRRADVSKELLNEYRTDPDGFLGHIVTQDETWVHHFDPETKL